MHNDGHEIRETIGRVIKGLYNSYQSIVLDCFIELWYYECKYKVYPPDPSKSERLQNIIEILLYIGVGVEEFINYLPRSRRMRKLKEYYSSSKKNGDVHLMN